LRILIISQYFWPENFRINEIAKYLCTKNCEVDVLTGQPNYPGGKLFSKFKKNSDHFNKFHNANIIRVPIFLRRNANYINLFLNYISFIISTILFGTIKLRKKKYDIIFTFGTSPITSALPSIYFSKIKNAKTILWVLDIWPDIIKDIQTIRYNILYSLLIYITKLIYNKTNVILVQSRSFSSIIKKYSNFTKINYFPAWPEELVNNTKNNLYYKEKLFIKKNFSKYSFKIVFTGNIGEAQNFNNVLQAAFFLKENSDICWIIVGTGRKILELKKMLFKLEIKNFYFIGIRDLNLISLYHEIADVLLVSLLGKESLSTTIPGKIQTYMQSNKYILGFLKGEGARIIQDSKAGEAVNPDDYKLLADRIIFLKNNPQITKNVTNKKYGEKYCNKFFKRSKLLKDLYKLFIDISDTYNENLIKLITNTNLIPYKENFVLAGLNLAFLGYLSANKLKIESSTYHWPDGLFYKRFFSDSISKIPGRDIIVNLNLPEFIKKIYVFGLLSENSKNFLEKIYNRKIIHINLPFSNVVYLFNNFAKIKFTKEDLIILTLPTPKQEQFAQLISLNSEHYKIICIGGAISMASGDEKMIPKFLDEKGLEFIWRLRTDTRRRVFRLFYTIIYYLLGEITFLFRNLKKKIIS
jgi:glycosyltransferase involved in cell wall biosynthesis